MKCPACGVSMKPLFTGMYCPENCDRPELKRKVQYEAAVKDFQAVKFVQFVPFYPGGVSPPAPAQRPARVVRWELAPHNPWRAVLDKHPMLHQFCLDHLGCGLPIVTVDFSQCRAVCSGGHTRFYRLIP